MVVLVGVFTTTLSSEGVQKFCLVFTVVQQKCTISYVIEMCCKTSGLKGTVEHSTMYSTSLGITPLYSWYL